MSVLEFGRATAIVTFDMRVSNGNPIHMALNARLMDRLTEKTHKLWSKNPALAFWCSFESRLKLFRANTWNSCHLTHAGSNKTPTACSCARMKECWITKVAKEFVGSVGIFSVVQSALLEFVECVRICGHWRAPLRRTAGPGAASTGKRQLWKLWRVSDDWTIHIVVWTEKILCFATFLCLHKNSNLQRSWLEHTFLRRETFCSFSFKAVETQFHDLEQSAIWKAQLLITELNSGRWNLRR